MRADLPPTSRLATRHALAHSVNRDRVLELLGRRAGRLGSWLPGAGPYDFPALDEGQAREWMGRGKLGQAFHVVMGYDADGVGATVARALQGDWSRLGIYAELRPLRGRKLERELLGGLSHLVLVEEQPWTDDPAGTAGLARHAPARASRGRVPHGMADAGVRWSARPGAGLDLARPGCGAGAPARGPGRTSPGAVAVGLAGAGEGCAPVLPPALRARLRRVRVVRPGGVSRDGVPRRPTPDPALGRDPAAGLSCRSDTPLAKLSGPARTSEMTTSMPVPTPRVVPADLSAAQAAITLCATPRENP